MLTLLVSVSRPDERGDLGPLRGLAVTSVQTAYLPRNKPSLRDAVIVLDAYDEQVALDTIARADRLATWTAAMGVDAVLAATGGHTGAEFSCSRFDATIAAPGHRPRTAQLDGLIAPQTPDTQRAGSNAA